jgi:putative flippase GtrA
MSQGRGAFLGLGRGSLARNAGAGVFATLIDFALVTLLVSRFATPPPLATLIGCLLGAVVNFTINRHWAFRASTSVPSSLVRYGLVSGASALLNAAGVALLLALSALSVAVPYQLVWWLVRGLVSVFFNFPMQRAFVFAHRE